VFTAAAWLGDLGQSVADARGSWMGVNLRFWASMNFLKNSLKKRMNSGLGFTAWTLTVNMTMLQVEKKFL
jgi:hypothetical protein